MEKKIKVLWYGDSPTVQTGFGRVARELLTRLKKTGKYEISVLGLNDRGEPSPYREEFDIYPCPDLEHDPYGMRMLPHVLVKTNPDVLLTLNDIWLYTGFPENGNVNWFRNMIKEVKSNLPIVCYFTIDGKPNAPEWDEFIEWVTVPVVMSDYGEQTVLETARNVEDHLMKAYHGSSVEYFYPLPEEEKKEAREELLRGQPHDDDTFIIGVVSRNQPRKNLPSLLHAFKKYVSGYWVCPNCGYYLSDVDTYCEKCTTSAEEVKAASEKVEGNSNAYLYLHLAIRDARGYKLDKIINDNKIPNVLVSPNHDIAHGVPVQQLNRIYNAFDVMCQPTFAEGYGLPPIEAASAGLAVIATHSTTMVEMFKDGRGELVLADSIHILPDAGHCRKHHISEEGLIEAFTKLQKDPELRKEYGKKAREFALTRTWDMAAEVMDEALQKAYDRIVDVADLYSDGPNPNRFMVVSTTQNPEEIISIIPAIKELSKKENAEIVCAVDERYASLLDNFDCVKGVVDKYAVMVKDKLTQKQVKPINFTGVWESYARAIYPAHAEPASEFYCKKLGMNCNSKVSLKTSADERKWVKEFFADTDGKTKIFLATAGTANKVYNFTNWSKVIEYLEEMDGVVIYCDLDESVKSEPLKNTRFIGSLDLRKQLLIAKECEILTTCDNIFLMLAHSFKGYTIGLSAGTDIRTKYDMDDYTVLAKSNGEFPCWPCERISGTRCLRTGNDYAGCINEINPMEIVGLINKVKKEVS